MADPLSISASILGISTAFLQASKGLYESVSAVKDAPQEIAAVARDTHTFDSNVASIARILELPKVQIIIDNDAVIEAAFRDIENGLDNCTKAIERLSNALQGYYGRKHKHSVKDISWFWKKGDILGLVGNLANCKATLGINLNAATLVLQTLQVGTINNIEALVQKSLDNSLGRRKPDDVDVGSVLETFTASAQDGAASAKSSESRFIENMIAAGLEQDYLYRAIEDGNEPMLRSILDSVTNVDVDALHPSYGSTPLCMACESDNEPVARTLLAFSADVDKASMDGNSPLAKALLAGNENIVDALFAHNTKIDADDTEGQTQLHRACKSSNLELVRALIARGASIDQPSKEGGTPLHIACSKSSETDQHIVEALLASGATLCVTDRKGMTPLHEACYHGGKECSDDENDEDDATVVNALLTHHTKALIRNRAASPAEYKPNLWTVKSLIEASDRHGRTALHFAVDRLSISYGYEKANIQCLIENGADMNVRDQYGSTALHEVSKSGRSRVSSEFLIGLGADVRAVDNQGLTPLHYAAMASKKGCDKLAKILLDHGANPYAQASSGQTPLHCAADSLGKESWLATSGLIENRANVHLFDYQNRTALSLAADPKSSRTKIEKMWKILIEAGIDLDVVDQSGSTALHYAAQREFGVSLLVMCGAKVSVIDGSGAMPAYYAALAGAWRSVKLLKYKAAPSELEDMQIQIAAGIMARRALDPPKSRSLGQ